ncbi:MAG TPA: lysophospholipid acyltransferase family protein [Flavipsychrobacter sp.]|nr:lysophospholipid acyltransferase family protein [Flavipsychrobacter sp.]
MIRIIFQPFYTLFVLATFVASLVIAFPVFLIIGTSDTPKARRIITAIVQYWARGWLFLIGMPIRVRGHFPKDKKFVIVANHVSYLDTVNIYAALPEYFRTLAKKEMVKIPVFGFVYKQLAILVDRSSAESRAKSMRLMWRQLRNECHIAVFPEGGFNETDEPMTAFYDGAFRLAINAQIPVLPLLFPDTVKRWHFSGWWKLWPGRNRAVFLHPVSVEGLTLKDVPELKEKVRQMMAEKMVSLNQVS